jgi:hypothetical protein
MLGSAAKRSRQAASLSTAAPSEFGVISAGKKPRPIFGSI